ncbi:type-F conjugative transfer system pilin assembly protein TrbC [Burkholderia glumae]|uniref:type-F conjugative transfer system pilin assembly protein TrbC n=1 Tax=Burkholderia glumae TaxID=337 RepID=UPI002036CECC|nr:type-F conjugative transfer system pilin assembly protein TrbC [Burkholderia glumae]MCM2547195.1 type-F conjugative transfer system pilin assembly protein TrbC [Burkholderia glumae]UVT05797.1 type-F conjugative transfer system pilin assembly protein TrbC [Burkholderia glumae]
MSPTTRLIVAAAAASFLLPFVTEAQTLSSDALAREQQRVNAGRRATFDAAASGAARYHGAMPTDTAIDAEMARIQGDRQQQMRDAAAKAAHDGNDFPNLPTPARPAASADPLAIAKRYEGRMQRRVTDSFVAFASFSMPDASLVRLIKTMHIAGGTVVFRGFKDDSLKATAAEMQRLGVASGGIVVNPKAFTQYRVSRVPAFVVTQGGDAGNQVDSSGCALPQTFVSVSGDVTPGYALRQIVEHSPAFAANAGRYLRALGDVE